MLKKWGSDKKNGSTDSIEKNPQQNIMGSTGDKTSQDNTGDLKINSILKGSKVTGDINVTCDLVLSGDVEGNITARDKSNVVIKGSCKGNIESGTGDIDIRGELKNGNIATGGNVSVSGKFTGGEVKAKGKIFVDCEFTGRLEGNEIDIGPRAHVKGELFYTEYISIARGARVEVQLCRIQNESKAVQKAQKEQEPQTPDITPPVKELAGVK